MGTTPESDKDNKSEEQLLDLTPLMSMFDDDMDVVRDILHQFIAPTEKNINQILDAFQEKSADDIEMVSHRLKSSSRSVGAYELGDICEHLEQAGKQGDWPEIERLVPLLQPLMENIVTRIKEL